MDSIRINGVSDETNNKDGPEFCHKSKSDSCVKSSEPLNGEKEDTCNNGLDASTYMDVDMKEGSTGNGSIDEKMDVEESRNNGEISQKSEQEQTCEENDAVSNESSEESCKEKEIDSLCSEKNEKEKKQGESEENGETSENIRQENTVEDKGHKQDSMNSSEKEGHNQDSKNREIEDKHLNLSEKEGHNQDSKNREIEDQHLNSSEKEDENDSSKDNERSESENIEMETNMESSIEQKQNLSENTTDGMDDKTNKNEKERKNDETDTVELDDKEVKVTTVDSGKEDNGVEGEKKEDNKKALITKDSKASDSIQEDRDSVNKEREKDDIKNNTSNRKDVKEDTKVTEGDTCVKDKIDIDGDEFIITINEDHESDKEEDHKSDSSPNEATNANSSCASQIKPNNTKNHSTKTVVSDSDKNNDNKTASDKPISDKVPPNASVKVPALNKNPSPTSVLAQQGQNVQSYYNMQGRQILIPSGQQANAGTVRYLIPSVSGTASQSSPQLVQHLVVTSGGQQLLLDNSSAALSSKTPFSSLLSKTASNVRSAAPLSHTSGVIAKAPSVPSAASTENLVQEKKTENSSKGEERDITLPVGSWEMLDIVKWEVASHKPDNTFWTGLCNVNKKAEVSSITKFLFDLGSDIVKESAYRQITHVQQKKKDAGKLTDLEQVNLEKMKKVVKELEDKLTHLSLKKKRCNGCDFVTESENVMSFHKEHPHMDPPLNPHGEMNCCYCDYKTKEATEFSFHMEAEHSKTGRVYSKPAFFQCGLCYFEHNQKNKLTGHKWKCMKHFKANHNQAPQHLDVNYCLKNTFYKFQIKKPAGKQNQHKHDTRKKIPSTAPSKPPMQQIQPRTNTPTIKQQTGINYIRTPVAYTPHQTYPNFGNRNVVNVPVVGRVQNMFPVQQPKTNTGLVRQAIPINRPQLQPQLQPPRPQLPSRPPYRPPQQKPTVGQLLKNSKEVTNKMPAAASGGGFEVCEICGGYVKDKMSLRIHFFYAHKIDMPLTVFNRDAPPLICEVCKARFWTTQGLTKHKQAARHNMPANKNVQIGSICWICHQKQDNLYTHLVKFHRLSTGECMTMKRCMFCGHLASSRKELEIHMAAAHGVIIKAEAAANPGISSTHKQIGPQTVVVGPTKAVVNTTTKTKGGQGLVRNNFCVFCSTQFSDNTQLTLHCLGTHATCSSCGMVVAKQADLAKHVCRTMLSKTCPICKARNLRPNFYTKHLVSHMKKCSVRVKRLSLKDIHLSRVKVKDDVLFGLKQEPVKVVVKQQPTKVEVKKSNVTIMKKVDIDNSDNPIVLDSDDESKESKAAEKRKLSSTKDNVKDREDEPMSKKNKVEEEKSETSQTVDKDEDGSKNISAEEKSEECDQEMDTSEKMEGKDSDSGGNSKVEASLDRENVTDTNKKEEERKDCDSGGNSKAETSTDQENVMDTDEKEERKDSDSGSNSKAETSTDQENVKDTDEKEERKDSESGSNSKAETSMDKENVVDSWKENTDVSCDAQPASKNSDDNEEQDKSNNVVDDKGESSNGSL